MLFNFNKNLLIINKLIKKMAEINIIYIFTYMLGIARHTQGMAQVML
jgi:hypothetical protein